jgi:hypothetical protein
VYEQVATHYLYRLVDQHKEFEDGILEFKVRMRLLKKTFKTVEYTYAMQPIGTVCCCQRGSCLRFVQIAVLYICHVSTVRTRLYYTCCGIDCIAAAVHAVLMQQLTLSSLHNVKHTLRLKRA